MTGILQLLDMLTVKIKLVETVKHMQLTRRTAIKPTKKTRNLKMDYATIDTVLHKH